MKYLHLLWRNLTRKKLRTALTVLSILVAFLLFGYLSAIRQAFSMGIDVAGADRLVVRHKVSIIQFLPESYERRMEQIDGVASAVHQTWFGGIYQDPKNFFAQMPIQPAEFLEMYPEYLLEPEEREAFLNTRTGAIAGITTAERFGWKVGDRIPIEATIWTKKDGSRSWEFDLVGIYEGAEKGTDTTAFFFRYDYFDEARQGGQGNVGWYTVRIDDPDRAAEIAEAIDHEIIIAIVTVVFFTILLVSGNTMAQSVRERIQELGVLKALGFTHRGVLGLVLAESCLIAVLGGALGLALAGWLISFGDPTPTNSLPIFYFPAKDVVIGGVLVVLLGLAAGFFPAVRALRLQTAEALRR
jgi:putative ABC transport system permease protein